MAPFLRQGRGRKMISMSGPVPNGVSWVALFLAYAVVGALIGARRPAIPIGWLFLCQGLLFEFTAFSLGYTNTSASLVRPRWTTKMLAAPNVAG
jgi:hypothetical protein